MFNLGRKDTLQVRRRLEAKFHFNFLLFEYFAHSNSVSTRIHSSRMRTAHSSSRVGGLHQAPHWEQAPPQSRPPLQDMLGYHLQSMLG